MELNPARNRTCVINVRWVKLQLALHLPFLTVFQLYCFSVSFSCLQSFPESKSFPVSQHFASGGQSIRASASASVLPMNIQGWFFRIDWFDLLAIQGILKSSSSTSQFESINSLPLSLLYGPTLPCVHDYWKNYSFDCMDLCRQSGISAFEYAV